MLFLIALHDFLFVLLLLLFLIYCNIINKYLLFLRIWRSSIDDFRGFYIHIVSCQILIINSIFFKPFNHTVTEKNYINILKILTTHLAENGVKPAHYFSPRNFISMI